MITEECEPDDLPAAADAVRSAETTRQALSRAEQDCKESGLTRLLGLRYPESADLNRVR